MQRSRRELIEEFLSHVGNEGDRNARTRAERLLNRVLETIWLKRDWPQLEVAVPHEFTTQANVRAYTLPPYFGRVGGTKVLQNLTQGCQIEMRERVYLERRDPAYGTSRETAGIPRFYRLEGTSAVTTQPAAAGEAIEVLSSSAADTTVRVFLEGLTDAGVWTRTEVDANGVNPVALGTFRHILKFGKAYPATTDPAIQIASSVGTITLRTVAAQTTLQALLPDESAVELQTVVLAPIPDGDYEIAVPVQRCLHAYYRDADPIPANWWTVVLDKMVITWRAGDQDGLTIDTAATWTALADLVIEENAKRAPGRRFRQPFTG